MSVLKLSNNASSLLAADISGVATTLAISSGDEGNFPAPSGEEWFPLTVVDGAGNREHMRCTARSGVTLTVERAQEGSTALAWTAGARVELRLTAGAFHEHTKDASRLETGTVPNAVLPARMKEAAASAADIDAIAASGWYMVDSAVAGLPIAEDGYLWHVSIDADTAVQEFQPVNAMDRYGRRQEAGSWGSWYVSVIPGTKLENLAPVGAMMAYAGATAPSGWLFCYGQNISRTTYAALWTAIGSAHGAGDGSTTFTLPDLRGRVPAGKDNMGGTAAGRLTTAESGINGNALGAVGGDESHVLAVDELPAHSHAAVVTDPGHAHAVSRRQEGPLHDGGSTPYTGYYLTPANVATTPSATGITVANSPTGSGDAHPNVQPTIVVNWIIKY